MTELIVACVVLSGLALIAESLAVEFTDRITLTASNLPILLAMMFLGPVPAMIVAAVAGVWGCWRERSFFIALFNVADFIVGRCRGAFVFVGDRGGWGFDQSALSPGLLAAGVLAAAAYEFTVMDGRWHSPRGSCINALSQHTGRPSWRPSYGPWPC